MTELELRNRVDHLESENGRLKFQVSQLQAEIVGLKTKVFASVAKAHNDQRMDDIEKMTGQ